MFRIAIRRPTCTSLDFHAAIVTRFANCHFPDCHTSLNCPALTPAFSCGVACHRSLPAAGAGCFIFSARHCAAQRSPALQVGWLCRPLLAQCRPQDPGRRGCCDAGVQANADTDTHIYIHTYLLFPWAAPFEFTPLLLVTSS